jgi:flavorubredoxin
MQPVEIKPGIHWVGAVDWDLRYFHGYLTPRGTTYNAYLIVDDAITLVDTVKRHLFGELVQRVRALVDPARIDYLVVNHVEQDHAGGVADFLQLAPQAKVVISPRGARALPRYQAREWDFQVIGNGEELNTGSLTLKFVHTPMVHWPDSMVTYIPERALLLPNDAFGQHIATAERFDDEVGWHILREEAAKYYANIVLPYGDQVNAVLDVVAGLEVDMVAPSHGVVWRSHLGDILPLYRRWANHETERRAVIIYDTMWGSTHGLAVALQEGLETAGIPVSMRSLQASHMSEIMPEVLRARAVLVGCPTLNNGMLPSVSAFLTYLKGLRPKRRLGLAFGSHGWGGQGAKEVQALLQGMGWELPLEPVTAQYRADPAELERARATGRSLAALL